MKNKFVRFRVSWNKGYVRFGKHGKFKLPLWKISLNQLPKAFYFELLTLRPDTPLEKSLFKFVFEMPGTYNYDIDIIQKHFLFSVNFLWIFNFKLMIKPFTFNFGNYV